MTKGIMKYFIISLTFILCGCVTTNLYNEYYKSVLPVNNATWIKALQPVFLKKNEKPQLYTLSDKDIDIAQTLREYESKHYVIIGYASFVSSFESNKNLIEVAKKQRATLVLRGFKHQYSSVYGGKYYTSSYQVYHQFAYFLIKVKKKPDLGFKYANLTEKDRMKYKSNKGVLITLVYQDTPAFHSNLVRGDIIISCGKWKVQNSEDLFKAMKNHTGKKEVILQILRNGKKQKVKLTRNKNQKILSKEGSIMEQTTKKTTKGETVIGGKF